MKKFKYLFALLLMVIILPLNIKASEQLTLELDKTDLKIGDTLEVSIEFDENTKIYAFLASLKYDENVFEKIDETSFKTDEEITSISYNEENNKFGLINKNENINGSLFKIKLKVKENANVGDTNIGLTNISYSDGTTEFSINKISKKVSVTKDASTGEVLENNKENEIIEDDEDVLKTFSIGKSIILLSLVALILFVVVVYLRLKKKNDGRAFYILSIVDLTILLVIIGLLLITHLKQDVNSDNEVDYNDAEKIIDYIIGVEKEEDKKEEKPSNNFSYDVNGDGVVDVTDAGHTVQETKITVKLSDKKENDFDNKGELTLKFKAEIKPSSLHITKVKIDDKYYDVTLHDDNTYSVLLDYNKYGEVEFVITEVELNNGKTIKTKLKLKRELLKDKPYITKVELDEETDKMTFELSDKDNTFISGTVSLYNDKYEVLKTQDLQIKNELTYEYVEDALYHIIVLATYDLDSEKDSKGEVKTEDEIFTHSVVMGKDYNFKLTEASITDVVEKGKNPVISFTSTNRKKAKIEKALVTSKNKSNNYVITKNDGNNYEIELTDADLTPGSHTVTLDNVTLDTLKSFENEKDYKAPKLTYNILKDAPTITDINLTNNKNESNIKVTYKLNDTSDALTKMTVVLMDSNEKIVDKKVYEDINEFKKENEITLSYKGSTDGYYVVKFLSDYTLGDKYNYTEKSIGEKDILTQEGVKIKAITIKTLDSNSPKLYPTKNEKNYQIRFEIEVSDAVQQAFKTRTGINSNYTRVSSITVNGQNYVASQESGYNTVLTVTVPSTSGIVELKATKVQLEYASYYRKVHDNYTVEPAFITFDVLKDKPKIENLEIIEDYDNSEVTLKFDTVLDENAKEHDDSFIDGTVTLGNDSKTITKGHNTIKFENVEKDKNLNLTFTASFDLDSDIIEETTDKNIHTNETIKTLTYGLFNPELFENVKIENGKFLSNDKYFEKGEKVNLEFEVTGLPENSNLNIEKIIANNTEYKITKNNDKYEFTHEGYINKGEREIKITELILDNGKHIVLTDPYIFTPVVLKDAPSIDNYKFTQTDDTITPSFKLLDYDKSIIDKAKIIVTNDKGVKVLETDYQNEITINKEPGVLRYNVVIKATYDRDEEQKKDNYYPDVVLLDEIISLDKNNIELKEITNINLYKTEDEKTLLIKEITLNELSKEKDKYFVEINMENMPSVHARIKSVVEDNNHLLIVLDYTYVTRENTNKEETVRFDFGKIDDNGVAKNVSHPLDAFEVLIEELKEAKSGETVKLNRDYDLNEISVSGDAYLETDFVGILDGNNHTIKNLKRPLFKKLSNAEVKNLKLENIVLGPISGGSLAFVANNSKITNVLVDNVVRTTGANGQNGGLIGVAENKTTIDSSRVINAVLNVGDKQQNGLLVGNLSNSTITNSYAIGSINATWNNNGGLVGMMSNSTLKKNYVKGKVSGDFTYHTTFNFTHGSGTYMDNLSLVTGGESFASSGSYLGNYQLADGKQGDISGVTVITKEEVNKSLFTDRLSFSTDIWKIEDNTSYDNTPKLKTEKEKSLFDTSHDSYDEKNTILYKNLMKLMPYYDSEKIIETSLLVTDDLLKTKEISQVVPVDKKGNIVTYLTDNDVKKISKIKVVYKTKEKKFYDVVFDRTYDMVASYRIKDLGIDYNYSNYVIDSSSHLVTNLTNYLKGLNYADNLDILTTTGDSRLYKEFYNEVTKNELKEFVLKYLSNSNYNSTTNDDAINDYLERELKKNQRIEKVLYTYNYFRRFYDVDIDGMKLYDYMMFGMKGFNKELTPDKVAELYLSNDNNFNTARTSISYGETLGNYTKLDNMPKFLEYMVSSFSNSTDLHEWTRNQFKGYLVEIPVKENPKIQYTLWDHFSHPDGNKGNNNYDVYNFILPILTLPENAAYIISSPVQFVIGAERSYIANPDDPTEMALFKRRVKSYTDRMTDYFKTAYGLIQDETIFNNIHTYHLDKRFTKELNGATIYQQPYSTEEPFHKNFNEVVGKWAYSDGNAAVAYGDRIEWSAEGLMDGNLIPELGTVQEYTYHTWSHESAHNIDARLFLKNNGRRWDAGGEDYADSNLMQSFGPNDIVMNLSVYFDEDDKIGSNLTPERIDTPTEVQDFYNKAFQAIYVLDYIEAQAFLQLDDYHKSLVGVQVSYPNETKYNDPLNLYRSRLTTGRTELTEEMLKNMELNDIEDLYDNRIGIYPGLYLYGTRGANSYGGENITHTHWYQPNNPYGRPDSYSIKWFAYEMLGYAGYNNGYIEYYSNIHPTTQTIANDIDNLSKGSKTITDYKTDLMALKTITKYDSFKEYKMARFEETKNNLDKLDPSVVNVKELVQKFYDLLISDGEKAKEDLEKKFASKPWDVCKTEYWCPREVSDIRSFKNRSALRTEIYHKLKQATNDFTEDIFKTSHMQDVNDLTVTKKEAE